RKVTKKKDHARRIYRDKCVIKYKKGMALPTPSDKPACQGKADAVTRCPADGRLPGQLGVETRPWRSQCSWE
ncbi:MAG: hypothetical protein ACFNWT_07745, partial [Prevotella denticola]